MRMLFALDGTHELEINGDAPRLATDKATVNLTLRHTPPRTLTKTGEAGDEFIWIQPETETKLYVNLKPSHARAVASALLSAATEARA